MNPDIVCLRDDFRLDDQPAIAASAERPALYVYVHDQSPRNGRPLGGAAKWRLYQSLKAMERRLAENGARLDVLAGPADATILALARAAGASRVLWTRRYEAAGMALDAAVKAALRERGVEGESFNGRLIREPWEFDRGDGHLPRSFSAFFRRHQSERDMPAPKPAPARLSSAPWPEGAPERAPIEALRLTTTKPDWSGELALGERPGEEGGLAALRCFVEEGLSGYASDRDLASGEATSHLSPHLRFGEVSAIRAAYVVDGVAARQRLRRDAEKFLSELGWRDFAALLLYAHPDLAAKPLRPEFERFPFREDEAAFRAWSRGETGYPIVDAGMRQLWRTGFMHNRVRLVAASFLVKHLLIDWRRGEEWFWDTLCDADPASNPMNWQWVAGSGADAAPFFRIFNPMLQAEKFDPDGAYVRRWVPELARLEAPHVHRPWNATEAALSRAGVVLGKTYPRPMVDHAAARARALAAFEEIKAEPTA
ncbi:MAG TPA: deoxyribodipyrimidine photo-lyase [Roseiarcus sp.]|nr:deoxyribodipyrimidine photo-lyase [Roseiarcus sp.]